MSLENKVIGIVFINDPEIKDGFKYELTKLKSMYKVKLMPILKEDYFNKNIDIFSKITKNKPLFYNKGIILEKYIKNFDFLILVGCSGNTINKLVTRKFDNNILNIVKICMLNKIPVIVGINIKNFNNVDMKNLELLYKRKEYFFIPFKITNPITNPNKLSFDSSFFIKTISLAEEKNQIEPILNFL